MKASSHFDSYRANLKFPANDKEKVYLNGCSGRFTPRGSIELEAVREFVGQLDTNDLEGIAGAVRDSMERFGLSLTAMRYHLWNTFDRQFALEKVPVSDTSLTYVWEGQESYADDMFKETPITRRGRFAGIVVEAEKLGWLTEKAASFYLRLAKKCTAKTDQSY